MSYIPSFQKTTVSEGVHDVGCECVQGCFKRGMDEEGTERFSLHGLTVSVSDVMQFFFCEGFWAGKAGKTFLLGFPENVFEFGRHASLQEINFSHARILAHTEPRFGEAATSQFEMRADLAIVVSLGNRTLSPVALPLLEYDSVAEFQP